jgi:hypothetical protein
VPPTLRLARFRATQPQPRASSENQRALAAALGLPVGLSLPRVRLVTRKVLGIIDWCLTARVITPESQSGCTESTGCHQLVSVSLPLHNDVKSAVPQPFLPAAYDPRYKVNAVGAVQVESSC